jgi:hypothetical protein
MAQLMWSGFDPDTIRELAALKTLVKRSRQAPVREWPLMFDAEHNAVLVVREWQDGQITAYWMPGTLPPP